MSEKEAEHILLFIDGDAFDREVIAAEFTRRGLGSEFLSLAEGRQAIIRGRAAALFLQWDLAGASSLLQVLRDGDVRVPVIAVLRERNESVVLSALAEGIDEWVMADAGPAELYAALQRALVRHKQEQWNLDRQRSIIERQRRWVELFDAITDYIFVIDEERRFVRVNQSFATSVGLHPRDLIGKHCGDILGADFTGECAFEAVREELTPYTYEKQAGEELFQISVFPLHEGERLMTIHVMKNVTETRRLKDQLYHADKLASLGLLVSGVAHEINNPLTGAIAYTELLRMKVKDEGVLAELKKVLDSAERCKKIVDNLLTFSRQRTPSKSLESMNDIIDRAIDLRGYWLKSSNIEVVRDFDERTTVFVDSQQIQQVVLNLLLNAEQAIVGAGRKKGRITFTTRSDRQSRTVMVQVADNGGGIPAAELPKIFDPFYTTKPVGVGTGLGLSISHGIITEHGGAIEVLSPAGGGALFTITLPTGADRHATPGC